MTVPLPKNARAGVQLNLILVAACRSGGIGQIDHRHLEKNPPEVGMLVIKIGGPAYRIGMGGGAASSVPSGGSSRAELDFNAVQVCYLLFPCLTLMLYRCIICSSTALL